MCSKGAGYYKGLRQTNKDAGLPVPVVNHRILKLIRNIASLRINLSLKTVQLSPPIFGHFCEYIGILVISLNT